MSATTAPRIRIHAVSDAVKSIAATCVIPTLITLTAVGDTVTGRPETVPGAIPTPDSIGPLLTRMAQLIARHPAMFDATDVIGYAVVLPGERVALAADRNRIRHHVQLPGAPTEPLRRDRWDIICDGLTEMINAVR